MRDVKLGLNPRYPRSSTVFDATNGVELRYVTKLAFELTAHELKAWITEEGRAEPEEVHVIGLIIVAL